VEDFENYNRRIIVINRIRRLYHESRYRKVEELIDKKGKLLDIGCGKPCEFMNDGSFLNYIGYGIGIDIKKCEGVKKVVRGDVQNLPFKNESFDIIVAMEVLEHVNDIELSLKNIREVLKPDGIFIMSTPKENILWGIFWFIWENTIGRMWKDTHKIKISKEQWINKVKKHFEISDIIENWNVDFILKMRKKK